MMKSQAFHLKIQEIIWRLVSLISSEVLKSSCDRNKTDKQCDKILLCSENEYILDYVKDKELICDANA